MEDALVQTVIVSSILSLEVLILVLMEDALVQRLKNMMYVSLQES